MFRMNLPNRKRAGITLSRAVGITLLLLGLIAFTIAVAYSSSIPAFIGLGLTFWGIILIYIQNEVYIKNTILDATATSLLRALDRTLQELDYRGKAIYLPPKYLSDPEAAKAYIPRQRTGRLAAPEQTQRLESQPSSRDAQAMLITPPGAELTRLFEQALGTSFARTDLDYLERNLPRLLIEDLEIVTTMEIQRARSNVLRPVDETINQLEVKHDRIRVKITTPAYRNIFSQAQQLPMIYASIGCPLTSAVACAIAKATGKPTTIETQQISEDGQAIETEYRFAEEEQV